MAPGENRVELGMGLLIGIAKVRDEDDRVKIGRIEIMSLQDLAGKLTLQRGVPETIVRIKSQHESHDTVAKSADTVVENEGVAGEIGGLHWYILLIALPVLGTSPGSHSSRRTRSL